MTNWISVSTRLPAQDQRVLAFVPNHKVFLPGMEFRFEIREVVVLRFCENFYADDPEKKEKHGVHFWSGEGVSNQFFSDVTHWLPIPAPPAA